MVLVECSNGASFVVDCNITEDNQDRVLAYIAAKIGQRKQPRGLHMHPQGRRSHEGSKSPSRQLPVKGNLGQWLSGDIDGHN